MKIFLIIIGIVNIIYYILACLGMFVGTDEDDKSISENLNIFTLSAFLIFLIIIGLIPIVNFLAGTAILFYNKDFY